MKSVARFAIASVTLAVAVGPSGGAGAQSSGPAEELYTDYFGCWTCHGPRGEGGDGRPLRGTYLPLSLFIKELRLPAGEMPPFSDLLATDDELAAVYAWLEGADPVAGPPPLTLTLSVDETSATASGIDVTLITRLSGLGGPGGDARFRHRVTLMTRDNSLVADHPLQLRSSEAADWATLTTDRYGQLLLGPPAGTALSELPSPDGEAVRLRLTLPEGVYVLVVEAISTENPGEPTVLGVGSLLVPLESSRVER